MTRVSEPVIEVAGLVKTFGRTRALDGLELHVGAGEIHGFLGPNGAGKTTTLRVLLGLLRADTGTVKLFGRDPWREAKALHRRLAYVPGDVSLWPSLTGGEVIELLGRLQGSHDAKRRDDLLARFELDSSKKCRHYSKGNRQKVLLVAAFAADAELLMLDEPTSGLDPLMEVVFRECIAEARERGATVLLSSHIFAEVEALCDRVSIVRSGRTVESGTLSELRHLTRTKIRAEVVAPLEMTGVPGIYNLEHSDTGVSFSADADALGPALGRLSTAGVRSLVSQPPTLEELFLHYYETRPGAQEVRAKEVHTKKVQG